MNEYFTPACKNFDRGLNLPHGEGQPDGIPLVKFKRNVASDPTYFERTDWSFGTTTVANGTKEIASGFTSLNAAALQHVDFWPRCLEQATLACDATYEPFGILVSRANRWFKRYPRILLINCETLDKKVISVKDVYNSSMSFQDEEKPSVAVHVKGLRLWYQQDDSVQTDSDKQFCYCDCLPRQLNIGEKYPVFESAVQLFARINVQLQETRPRWNIIGTETINLKIGILDWDNNADIDTSATWWFDTYNANQLSFLRVFYFLENTECCEQIGMEDFSPDTIDEGGIFYPAKYSSLSTLVRSATLWISKATNVRILNIQTLDTKHLKKSELMPKSKKRFRTERMFENEIEGRFRAFYLRVTYKLCLSHCRARLQIDGTVCHTLCHGVNPAYPLEDLPVRLGCKTFIPIKRAEGYENVTEVLEKVVGEMRVLNTTVFYVQTVCLPEWLTNPALCEHGDRTYYDGEWYFTPDKDGNDLGPFRYPLVYALRVFFDCPPIHKALQKRLSVYSNHKRKCCTIV